MIDLNKEQWIKSKLNSDALKQKFINDKINYIRPILLNDESNKLSIICKFKEVNNKIDDSYYGLHPKITENEIKRLITNGILLQEDKFNEYILENKETFKLDNSYDEYSEMLHKKTILNSASRFSYMFNTKITKEEFIEIGLIENIDFKITNNYIYLLGSITTNKLNLLRGFDIVNNEIIKNHNKFLDLSNYNLSENKDNEYYNGVLAKVVKINESDELLVKKIKKYNLVIHRTTYFTVDSFESTHIHEHEYLNNYKASMKKIYLEEMALRRQYLEDYQCNSLDNINEYLSKTFSTLNIGVSSNIITSDNKLIISKRGANVIDGGKLYCSANGQVEFYDKNVALYNESSYEDCPSFTYKEDKRIDFNNELTREVVAELGISTNIKWEYYGLSLLGRLPNNESELFRLHFNILATTNVEVTSDSIFESSKTALESFENETLYAIEYYHFSFWTFILNIIRKIYIFVTEYKMILELLVFIIVMDWILKLEEYIFDKNTIFAILPIILIGLYRFIHMIRKLIKRNRNKKVVAIFNHNYDNALNKTFSKIGKNVVVHPISYIMTVLNMKKIK